MTLLPRPTLRALKHLDSVRASTPNPKSLNLGHIQVDSYRYSSLIQGLYKALKPQASVNRALLKTLRPPDPLENYRGLGFRDLGI